MTCTPERIRLGFGEAVIKFNDISVVIFLMSFLLEDSNLDLYENRLL